MKIKDKVLIVEDEQSISSFISMILTANGPTPSSSTPAKRR